MSKISPDSPETPAPAASTSGASPGIYVLQWLTYTFWGWLSLALIWLTWICMAHTVEGTTDTEAIPYALAATLVLLPLAFVVDLFYRKHEPVKKQGAAAVITVIHSVLFALWSIFTLIIAVFVSINTLIETGSDDYQIVAIVTLFMASLLGAAAFLRTLNPFKTALVSQIYRFGLLGLSLLLLVFVAVGPLVSLAASRDDRRITRNIIYVKNAVDAYIEENDAHPASLNDIDIEADEGVRLVEDGLVEYKKGEVIRSERPAGYDEYRYELCVEYARKDSRTSYSPRNRTEFTRYLATSGHPAGNVCYKLYATAVPSDDGEFYYE